MNANIDEKEWAIHMNSILNNAHEIDVKNPVCIFQVPKSIRNTTPEASTPEVVALGPYHHFRPKTYYMQKCKLSAALKARQELKLREIPQIGDAIMDKLHDIRASYHDNLRFQKETLEWMMLIDGLFLLSLIYNLKDNRHQIHDASEETDQFEDSRGRKYQLDVILKDVVLLENQIPKIVLDALLMETRGNYSFKRIELRWKLIDFCTGLSPIELQGNSTHNAMVNSRHQHVLDFLHQLVWLGKITLPLHPFDVSDSFTDTDLKDSDVKTWTKLYTQLSNLNFGFVSVILSMVDLILKILDALGISIPKDIFSDKEVLISSASQLSGVGVEFCRIEREGGGIKEIAFKHEAEPVTLSLPVLKDNVNSDLSEVVMRNLLAYKAGAMPEFPKFCRYIELMSALMQTTADVEMLKKADTDFHVVPEDANSAEVLKLFSSLNEAVGSKVESELDDTIKEVNGFYDSRRKVKIRRLVKRYLSVSWKVLTGIALILVVILHFWHTFCSMYSCPKIFKSQYLAYLVL